MRTRLRLSVMRKARLWGVPLNRALSDEDGNIYDIIAGNFLIVGLGEESFSDLSPRSDGEVQRTV